MVQLHPRIRVLWRIGYLATSALVVVAVGVAAVVLALTTGFWWGLVLVAVAGLAGTAVTVGWPERRYRCWRYDLTADALEIRHGVWWRLHSVIPYFRVQNIDITSGPIERALGLCTLALHTASAETDATIPGVDEEAAGELRRVILERAGLGDAA